MTMALALTLNLPLTLLRLLAPSPQAHFKGSAIRSNLCAACNSEARHRGSTYMNILSTIIKESMNACFGGTLSPSSAFTNPGICSWTNTHHRG